MEDPNNKPHSAYVFSSLRLKANHISSHKACAIAVASGIHLYAKPKTTSGLIMDLTISEQALARCVIELPV